MPLSSPRYAVFVLWQSLVVKSYRSFFACLAEGSPCRVALAAPERFRELGNQDVECAPFEPPFTASSTGTLASLDTAGLSLRAKSLHVQATWYRGLARALRSFFGGEGRRIFLCMSEPYSVTALLSWVAMRLSLRRDVVFVCCAMQNIHKRFPWPLAWMQAFVLRRCSAILTLGREHQEVLRRHGYRGECWDFPLWFDSRQFRPSESTEKLSSSGPVTIGYAGGLTEAKGVPDLIQALHILASDPKLSIRVRFVGGGPLADAVHACCTALRAAGCDAAYAGALPAERMSEFFGQLDLLVLPSRTMPHWKEQFGRVLIEAEATGALAIGSSSGEIPTVVADETRIFPEGNIEALTATLALWCQRLSDPVERASLRQTTAQRAFERYSDVRLAERFHKVITATPVKKSLR